MSGILEVPGKRIGMSVTGRADWINARKLPISLVCCFRLFGGRPSHLEEDVVRFGCSPQAYNLSQEAGGLRILVS
jgi:hypothetical protein